MSSSSGVPPVQQAYFAKRGEPVPYTFSNASPGEPRADGGYGSAGNAGLQHQALPAYTTHQAPDKIAIRGIADFRLMEALQTFFQLGILVCMIAMVAKLYQTPSLNSGSRF